MSTYSYMILPGVLEFNYIIEGVSDLKTKETKPCIMYEFFMKVLNLRLNKLKSNIFNLVSYFF